jgi:hypothetical protein
VVEPVVDLLPECVDPGDQRFEVPPVDFVLKPLDLITQVAQVLMDVVRTCFDQANGLWAGLQCVKRPVGQFADFPAQLGRTRPGAVMREPSSVSRNCVLAMEWTPEVSERGISLDREINPPITFLALLYASAA